MPGNKISFSTSPQEFSKTEDRILRNALKHFCDFGYSGTSVRDITAASEVTKPTLYYYFKNKEELYTRLANACFEMIIDKIKTIQGNGGLEHGINALFDVYEEILGSHPDALKFIYSVSVSPQRGSPEVDVMTFSLEIDAYIRGLVQRAVTQSQCLESKAESMTVVMSSLLSFHTNCLLVDAKRPTCQKIRSVVSTLSRCAGSAVCPPSVSGP